MKPRSDPDHAGNSVDEGLDQLRLLLVSDLAAERDGAAKQAQRLGMTLMLIFAGTALGLDRNGDGAMDSIEAGAWTGPTATAIFDGSVR